MRKSHRGLTIILVTFFVLALAGNCLAESEKININTASAQQLEALQGIGPTIAQRIVEYRESQSEGFASVDQLAEVKGIGPKTLAEIKDMVTIGD
ncbi:MAG: ComEA family DNA-binding protein [Thermodesulfobacteriota bacterium]